MLLKYKLWRFFSLKKAKVGFKNHKTSFQIHNKNFQITKNQPVNVRCKVSRQLHALQPCSGHVCQHETITPKDWERTSQPLLKKRFSIHVGHTDKSLVSVSYPVVSQFYSADQPKTSPYKGAFHWSEFSTHSAG